MKTIYLLNCPIHHILLNCLGGLTLWALTLLRFFITVRHRYKPRKLYVGAMEVYD